jgi:16S rRNA (guanine966-N2)-methyltransferase
MRVIAGTYRSRRLQTPRGDATRPTSDRLRETLFNVLAPRIEGAHFLDLYAGSGAVGIEAISRGAAFCAFAEKAPPALAALRSNLSTLGIRANYAIEDRGTARLLDTMLRNNRAADIVFLDPPYIAADEYTTTLETLARHYATLLAPEAIVIAEHTRKLPTPETIGALQRIRLLQQGDANLSFYRISP